MRNKLRRLAAYYLAVSMPFWCRGDGRVSAFSLSRTGGVGFGSARHPLETSSPSFPSSNVVAAGATATETLWDVVDGGDALLTIIDDYDGPLPTQIAYPFHYQPHPVAIHACDKLRMELSTYHSLQQEEEVGKMFGILVVTKRGHDEGSPSSSSSSSRLGYLKAYSGTLKTPLPGFCPMVYDRLASTGLSAATNSSAHALTGTSFCYTTGEAELNALNRQVEALERDPERLTCEEDLVRAQQARQDRLDEARREQRRRKQRRKESRHNQQSMLQNDPTRYAELEEQLRQESAADQRHIRALKKQLDEEVETSGAKLHDHWNGPLERLKEQRRMKSAELQNGLFEQYQFLNSRGEMASLLDIFRDTPVRRPPGGAGDCAAPKLFQHAFARGYTPVALAEFWWGNPPGADETIRKHSYYYPACRGKCEPILGHMLLGLNVGTDPLQDERGVAVSNELLDSLEVVYDDEYLLVVNKPADVLSVPGRLTEQSVYSHLRYLYPNATGPLLVHRLDMSTSGLLLVAKDKETHKLLSKQFIDRSVKKRYECLLDGVLDTPDRRGRIDLPLAGDYLNRPMQKVDFEQGKSAVTYYEEIGGADDDDDAGNDDDDGGPQRRTRVYLYPVTGRTHQLRVHAAHPLGLNLPIAGDDIYGQRHEAQRLCLHAGLLEITHPATGRRITFRSDAPF
jgi:tRNA pseudouridine32 synthase/23S rRNA pseudouridine746 synthase